MEQHRWEESERRRKEVRRSEKRKKEKKESVGARQGRKVTIHCVFSNDLWLPKAAGAEPWGQMTNEKLHAVVTRSTFPSEKAKKNFTFGPLLEVGFGS